MTYEECTRLVDAFKNATLLEEKVGVVEYRAMASDCADSIGEFIASIMAQAWKEAR